MNIPKPVQVGGGLFLLFSGTKLLFDAFSGPSPAAAPPALRRLGDGHRPVRAKVYDVNTLDERVRHGLDLIRKYGRDPDLHVLVGRILSEKCGPKWCTPEKVDPAEVGRLYWWARDHVRYLSDPVDFDYVQSPWVTLEARAGDCYAYTILLCSMLRSAGFQTAARVIHSQGYDSWNHIYARVGLPKASPTAWVPLDASLDAKPGWEAPGAEDVARTGKPSGIVYRVRDYKV